MTLTAKGLPEFVILPTSEERVFVEEFRNDSFKDVPGDTQDGRGRKVPRCIVRHQPQKGDTTRIPWWSFFVVWNDPYKELAPDEAAKLCADRSHALIDGQAYRVIRGLTEAEIFRLHGETAGDMMRQYAMQDEEKAKPVKVK